MKSLFAGKLAAAALATATATGGIALAASNIGQEHAAKPKPSAVQPDGS